MAFLIFCSVGAVVTGVGWVVALRPHAPRDAPWRPPPPPPEPPDEPEPIEHAPPVRVARWVTWRREALRHRTQGVPYQPPRKAPVIQLGRCTCCQGRGKHDGGRYGKTFICRPCGGKGKVLV